MNSERVTIIPFIHGKIAPDGRLCEPDVYWIIEKWLERHPEMEKRTQDIRIGRGAMTLPNGMKTDLIRATISLGDDIEGYDPAQDRDIYEYFLSADQGYREPLQNG